jgi:hypothetical protein
MIFSRSLIVFLMVLFLKQVVCSRYNRTFELDATIAEIPDHFDNMISAANKFVFTFFLFILVYSIFESGVLRMILIKPFKQCFVLF